MARVIQGTKKLKATSPKSLTDQVRPGSSSAGQKPGGVKQSIRVGSTLPKQGSK